MFNASLLLMIITGDFLEIARKLGVINRETGRFDFDFKRDKKAFYEAVNIKTRANLYDLRTLYKQFKIPLQDLAGLSKAQVAQVLDKARKASQKRKHDEIATDMNTEVDLTSNT